MGFRAGGGALLAAALAGWGRTGIGLGAVFFSGAALLPLIRVRWMRRETPTGWSDLRAEWELAVNVLVLAGSAVLVGDGGNRFDVALLELPITSRGISASLLTAGGALFLLRGAGGHRTRDGSRAGMKPMTGQVVVALHQASMEIDTIFGKERAGLHEAEQDVRQERVRNVDSGTAKRWPPASSDGRFHLGSVNAASRPVFLGSDLPTERR